MQRLLVFLFALLASSCMTLTPAGARVSIYNAPLNGPADLRAMPNECRKLSESAQEWMTEADIAGQAGPFTKQLNASAAAGGNVLLVLKEQIRSRRDPDCPASSAIRDCAGSSGAWYNVVFESYMCTPEAIQTLNTPKTEAH